MFSHKIVILMACAAFHTGNALAFKTAPYIHGVLVAIVSLAGKVAGGVAVHAAWMMEYRNDGLKRSSCNCIVALRGSTALRAARLLWV